MKNRQSLKPQKPKKQMKGQDKTITGIQFAYITEKISEHIYRISEMGLVSCYLIVGNERAMLVDCCDGISHIKDEIRRITNLPVFLVATHAHADHIGGAREFGKMYIHLADMPIVPYSNSLYQRTLFLKRRKVLEAFRETKRKLPLFKPYLTVKPFKDGKVFDLGGVKVEAIRTPGHTIGSCVMKIASDNIVLVGDNFIPMLYLHYPYAASLSRWVKSCEQFFEKAEGCLIYGGHGKNSVSREGILWQYETAKSIISCTRNNAPFLKREVIIKTHPEHSHLIVKYRTDKIL